jgi:hypothetical protein
LHQRVDPRDGRVPAAALFCGSSIARRMTPSAMIATFHSPCTCQYCKAAESTSPTIEHGDVLEPGGNHKRFQEWTVVKRVSDNEGRTDARLAVNMRVWVYPGTDAECPGVIVEDFGDLAGQAVEIGGYHIDPARRWAVVLDTGDLVFVNTDELVSRVSRLADRPARSTRRKGVAYPLPIG